MRTLSVLFTLALLSLASTLLMADEGKRQPAASGVVTIEVLIADVTAAAMEGDGDDQAVVAHIRELEKQGKLSRVTRIRLTTLSEQVALAQFGERAPLATGRASFSGRGGGGPGGGFPGGEGSTSYTYQNIGTMVEFIPRVDGGQVVMECKVEQSRLVPRKSAATATVSNGVGNQPAVERPERSFEPDGIETITARSVVQVKSGDTALLASRQLGSGDDTLRTYILVTAAIAEGGQKEAAVLKVFKLAHAKAATVGEALALLFKPGTLQISVDQRTNSIVARGQNEDLAICEALLKQLDGEE